ncbi:MAG: hypothetical protein ACLQLC_16530 [Candidatus Sulfotelmatobacter sp.]
MRRNRFTKPTRLIAGLISGLLLAIAAFPLVAQPASETRAGHGIGPVYDSAHEITLSGTIQAVVTKHAKGSPAGMHLMVMGSEGLVDAHVGSFLSKQVKEALHEGDAVRIVGAMTSEHGKSYLLARTLTVGGQTVKVRSEHGLLGPMPSGQRHARSANKTAVETNGGAR